VNTDLATDYGKALLASLTIGVIIPGLMFLLMVGVFIWVLVLAQRRPDFDASHFLRDDEGRLSSLRLFAFIACAVHTWVIAVETMGSRITVDQMAVYSVTWSSSLVLARFADKWNGALPWAKGPA
jgi:hypothetical protein